MIIIRPPHEGQLSGSTSLTLWIIPTQPNPSPAFLRHISRLIFNNGAAQFLRIQAAGSRSLGGWKIQSRAGILIGGRSVIKDYLVLFPEEIYEFHKTPNLNHMQFIPWLETDPGDDSRGADFYACSEALGKFIALVSRNYIVIIQTY
jgi:hypothetical protein